MAHYGGRNSPPPPPRVYRPRAPIMSAPPAPITAPLAPLRPPPPPSTATSTSTSTSISISTSTSTSTSTSISISTSITTPAATTVSLVAPRPENERSANEYVETPFRIHKQSTTPPPPPLPPQPPRNQRLARLALPPPPLPPVTKQPSGTTSFSKEGPIAAECISRPSIVCAVCGRCRCDSCQQPKPLPQRWICNNTCLMSADSIIDYASCLCCVKGLFYHCSESDGGASESCADNPCGCGPNKWGARWGCLGALSFALPCLWLYWPLRGCKSVVETCYARHSRTGCRCRPPLATPEKRLLDSSPDF